jgi:hypothetical protein
MIRTTPIYLDLVEQRARHPEPEDLAGTLRRLA